MTRSRAFLLALIGCCTVLLCTLDDAPHRVAQAQASLDCVRTAVPRPVSDPPYTTGQIAALFPAVVSTTGTYGPTPATAYQYQPRSPFGYNGPLGDENRYRALPPVLLNAIALVESGWTQYRDGVTVRGDTSCDWGMMQINEVNIDLFNRDPNLMSDTRGNIAAGAQRLAGWWNDNEQPVVNDQDPQRWLNWYYALTNYNSGKDPVNGWRNNPNCGVVAGLQCNEKNYIASRSSTSNWPSQNINDYPYQERVLYTLQYPRRANEPLLDPPYWDTSNLGLKPQTDRYDYGIRPDDSVFINPITGGDYTPNLLLFRQRYLAHSANELRLEYDLPLAARVTIAVYALVGNGVNPDAAIISTSRRILDSRAQPAGWTQRTIRFTTPLPAPFVYEITAERGTTDDLATYYLGRYRQRVNNPALANVAEHVYLPDITQAGVQPLLRNGAFTQTSAFDSAEPAFWEVQAVNAAFEAPLATLFAFDPQGQVTFRSGPIGRVEITQRVDLPRSGCYALRATVTRSITTAQLARRHAGMATAAGSGAATRRQPPTARARPSAWRRARRQM